ncbi:MAG: response regulator transcription factor [Cyanobacteriota bacterium]
MPRVLIVDDDPEIMDWLYLDLQLSGYTVDYATDGYVGLQKAQQEKYDCIILDVMMPRIDGFQVCSQLRQQASTKEVPIILLTAKGTLEDKIVGFNSGADDYLVKPFDIQELLVRLRALMRRSSNPEDNEKPSSENLSAGDLRLSPESLEVQIKDKIIKLTPTEFEILYCLMQHVNQAVSLSTILDEVWGYEADEDVRMLRVHIGGLRQKIEENHKKPKYLQTVTNVGYKLVPWAEKPSSVV